MLEKAPRTVHCSEILYATSTKVPDEGVLRDRRTQIPYFDAVEPQVWRADSAKVAVAEVLAAIYCIEDFECLES